MPAYVEQMFDRLEASGIIVGWNRDDWDIWTTSIGLDIRIAPASNEQSQSRVANAAERGASPTAGPRRFASALIRSAAVLAWAVPGHSLTICR